MAEDTAGLKTFFIVVPPFFERLALYELNGELALTDSPLEAYELHMGGIELKLPLQVGLGLNRRLRIPTRILMRLETKSVLSFPETEAFFKSINWKQFGPLRDIYVSSRSSKMKMKDAIEKSFKKVVPFRSEKSGTDVYIRVFRDECTLSVDTSGDDLFVRGHQKWTAEAPIRDTFAAGLLQLSLQGIEDLSEWEVVDPMMGSGTFLSEALLTKTPAVRPFCFGNWKMEGLPEVSREKGTGPVSLAPVHVVGRDKVPKNIEIVQKNLRVLGLTDVDLAVSDLFTAPVQAPHSSRRRLVILNPPYGKRLAIRDKNLFQETLDRVHHVYAPDRIGIITLRGVSVEHSAYEKLRHFSFSNNGIDVDFFVFLKR